MRVDLFFSKSGILLGIKQSKACKNKAIFLYYSYLKIILTLIYRINNL